MIYDLYQYITNMPSWQLLSGFMVAYMGYYLMQVVKVSGAARYQYPETKSIKLTHPRTASHSGHQQILAVQTVPAGQRADPGAKVLAYVLVRGE